jgi:phosphoribosylglycinamide formyltransferase 1
MTRRRVAVLISGRGSNMASLIEAARDPAFPAEIVLVASNRPGAGGLDRARRAGIEVVAVNHQAFPDHEAFELSLDDALRARSVDLLCLAGFMRVLTPGFVEAWAGRMLNIHPSLLPLFRGTRTHERALAEGVLVHGCTVHYVVPELDAGPIIAQAAVPVVPGDTPDSLAARVLAQEHALYPAALRMVCTGAVRLEGGRALFREGWDGDAALLNPPRRMGGA